MKRWKVHGYLYLLCFHPIATLSQAQEHPRTGGPYKLLAADFTADGRYDLAVGLHDLGMLSIEQGNDQGQFEHLSITAINRWQGPGFVDGSFNLAAGDLDGDSKLDLAIGCRGKFVLLLRNQGKGHFRPMARFRTESDAKGVALRDLNQDGRLDLVYTARGTGRTGDTSTGRLYLRQGLEPWKFRDPIILKAGISAYYVEIADLNDDGFPDVLVPNELGNTVSFWISPGRSIFTSTSVLRRQVLTTTGFRVNDVRARDFTGDGKLDILTANWASSTLSLFTGNGDGTFQSEQQMDGGKHCVFFAVGDFDRDEDLDFAVTHWTENFIRVFLNNGFGQFDVHADYLTALGNYGVVTFDADGDENLDLLTANYRHHSFSVLNGRGDGTFQPARTTRRRFKQTQKGFVLDPSVK